MDSNCVYEQWKSSTTYTIGNTVQHITTFVYQCIREPCEDVPPPNVDYWKLIYPPPPTPSSTIAYYTTSNTPTAITNTATAYLSITIPSIVLCFTTVSAVFSFTNVSGNVVNNFVYAQIYINDDVVGIPMNVCPTNIAYLTQPSQMKVEYAGILTDTIPSNTKIELRVYCDTGTGISGTNATMTIVSGLGIGVPLYV